MSDPETQAREALAVIGEGPVEIYRELATDRLIEFYLYAETAGRWRILEELSKRENCSADKVLALAKNYVGGIGMIVLKAAIQPKLSQMNFSDLLVSLSRLNGVVPERQTPLKDALRREILERLQFLKIEEILNISWAEDAEIVQEVKRILRKRAVDLRTIAEV